MNQRFNNAKNRVTQKVPPIWFMRQAGRYHKHYQNLRAKYSFMQLCKEPELAAEVAMGPIDEFDFDVAILFSDLLFPLEAIGMGLDYTEQGPRLGFQLNEERFKFLKNDDSVLESLQFQKLAVQDTRERLPSSKSLIGFVGGLWTLYVYAVEGSHLGSLTLSKSQPQLRKNFFNLLLPIIEKNIALQLEGGAELVMIFDTAAGDLSPVLFREWVQPTLDYLTLKFPQQLGYYSKGTQSCYFNDKFYSLPWAGQGLDHHWNLPDQIQKHQTGFLQGNFDQSLLHLPTEDFRNMLEEYLQTWNELSADSRKGWVCGLGHGVLPKTPESHVKYFVERVREVFS